MMITLAFYYKNGGAPLSGGNNYPLRGAKDTYYDGGHRVPTIVRLPVMKARGISSSE